MQKIAEIRNNALEIYDTSQFDLDAIMHSGQVFRYFPIAGGYGLISGHCYAGVVRRDGKILVLTDHPQYFFDYFDLNTDYGAIRHSLLAIGSIVPAIEAGGGIRILRARFVETVISFIISANNNIKHFTKTLNLMCERFGEPIGGGLFAFPTLEQLSKITIDDFAGLGCGYRAAYLCETVRILRIQDEFKLIPLDNGQLKKELIKLSGVGPKQTDTLLPTTLYQCKTHCTIAD